MTASGEGVSVRVIAWHARDVIAIEVEDRRKQPAADPRRLADAAVRQSARPRHAATTWRSVTRASCRPTPTPRRCSWTSATTADSSSCRSSAKASTTTPRPSRSASSGARRRRSTTTSRPSASPPRPAPASSRSSSPAPRASTRKADVAAAAVAEVEAASAKGFDALLADNQAWWRRLLVARVRPLRSDDGVADEIEQNYTYFLYVMAASSRGDVPGALQRDALVHQRRHARLGLAILVGQPELLLQRPRAAPTGSSCWTRRSRCTRACTTRRATAARQQWGSGGIWIPETTCFNGPNRFRRTLPPRCATCTCCANHGPSGRSGSATYELQRPLVQQPVELDRAGRAVGGGPVGRRGQGRTRRSGTSRTSSGSTAKIAYLYWQRYEYTMDEAWLRDRAYPMLKGAVEFYRNFPNLQEGRRRQVPHPPHEQQRAGVGRAGLRRGSVGHARHRRPADPRVGDPQRRRGDAARVARVPREPRRRSRRATPRRAGPADYNGPRTWVKGLKPAAKPGGMLPDGNTLPMWNFELCHVETTRRRDAEAREQHVRRVHPRSRSDRRPARRDALARADRRRAARAGRRGAIHAAGAAPRPMRRATTRPASSATAWPCARVPARPSASGSAASPRRCTPRCCTAPRRRLAASRSSACSPRGRRSGTPTSRCWPAGRSSSARRSRRATSSPSRSSRRPAASAACATRGAQTRRSPSTATASGARRSTARCCASRRLRGEIVTVVPENGQRPQRKVA